MPKDLSAQPMDQQPDEDGPIGEMKLPGRPGFGARVYSLLGSSVGLGVAGVIGMTATLPTPPTTAK